MRKWKTVDGHVCSDMGSQLESMRKIKKVKEYSPELADALLDMVYANFRDNDDFSKLNRSPSFWYAVQVLDKCGIKTNFKVDQIIGI